MSRAPNQTRQPTPGVRLGCISAPLARRGCAVRYPQKTNPQHRLTILLLADVIHGHLNPILTLASGNRHRSSRVISAAYSSGTSKLTIIDTVTTAVGIFTLSLPFDCLISN
jgi:hypothetical protein